jgi:GT2 family glycosyltransferase
VILPPGALDQLAAILEAHPRAGLIGPRVRDPAGRIDRSVGHFPTLDRERAHAMLLDQLLGREGRRMTFPGALSTVDWISGSLWLLRFDAVRAVGPLDEAYFMYFEDVDYCMRLRAAGWDVLATPDVEVVHAIAKGSSRSETLPADGGEEPALHYFRKFHPQVAEDEVRRALAMGWGVRRVIHTVHGLLGSPGARARARRFALALQTLTRH